MGTGEGSGPWTPRKNTTLFSTQVQSSVFLLVASVFFNFSIKKNISRFSLSFIPAWNAQLKTSKENENNRIKKRYEGDIENDKVLWGARRVHF